MSQPNPDFRTFYKSTIWPVVESLEAERKKLTRIIFIYGCLFVAIILFGNRLSPEDESALPKEEQKPIDPYAYQNSNQPMPAGEDKKGGGFLIMFLLAGAGGYFVWLNPTFKKLKDRFGEEVTSSLVDAIAKDLSYQRNQGISQGELDKSKLFNDRIDRYYSSDQVRGKQESTSIAFSNVHIQKREVDYSGDSNNKESWRTVFHGVLYKADFNKEFKGETFVLTDRAEKSFGSLGTMMQKLNNRYGNLVKMEDVEFEKQFVVYATDAIEAHYLLSPALLQRILFLRTMFGNIEIACVASHLYMLIPKPVNQYNLKLFTSWLDFNKVEREYIHLKWICRIADELNLNTRIWTKK